MKKKKKAQNRLEKKKKRKKKLKRGMLGSSHCHRSSTSSASSSLEMAAVSIARHPHLAAISRFPLPTSSQQNCVRSTIAISCHSHRHQHSCASSSHRPPQPVVTQYHLFVFFLFFPISQPCLSSSFHRHQFPINSILFGPADQNSSRSSACFQ